MINLLPYKEKKSIERIRMIRIVRTGIVGAVCLCIVGAALLLPSLILTQSRYALESRTKTSLERDGLMASSIDIEALRVKTQNTATKLSPVSERSPTSYISMIRSVVPTGVTVRRYAVTDTAVVEVSGVTTTREALQEFIQILEDNTAVVRVDSPVSNFVKNSNSAFIITVVFTQP